MKYIITEEQVNKFKEDRWCKYIEEIVLSMQLKFLCGVQVKVIDNEIGDGKVIKNYLVILQSDYHNRDMENIVSQNINDYLPHLELIVIRLDCDTPVNIKESTTRKVLKEDISSYLDVEPFYKLPYPYQKSLMIFRNEGMTDDEDIKDLIDYELQTIGKRKAFYYGVVPIELIENEVAKRLEWDSFEDYHKWYGDEETDHGDSVLPVIIDFDDEELIVDGWHRFHSYVRKGLTKIPVLGVYKD